jgi:hypothetical protein
MVTSSDTISLKDALLLAEECPNGESMHATLEKEILTQQKAKMENSFHEA